MSTSTKQTCPERSRRTKANQENVQNSTGPKTEEGKKVSSQNAVKHGLNSVNIVINSPHLKEDQKDYDLLVAALIDELEPKSESQLHFVYKIANCHWRYRRLINAETAQINRQITPDRTPYSYYNEKYYANLKAHNELDDYLHSRSLPTGDESKILIRYEWRLNRELHHAYKMLRELQSRDEHRNNKKSQNEPIPPKPKAPQKDTPCAADAPVCPSSSSPHPSGPAPTCGEPRRTSEVEDEGSAESSSKKSQNEPIPPKPNDSQQPPRPTETDEYIDKVLDALQNNQPLPPEPSGLNPLDGFISAMEKKFGLR